MPDREEIEEAVRAHYGAAARRVGVDAPPGCGSTDGIGAGCYAPGELEGIPVSAVAASIGCANPVSVAELSGGEVVLDLGSGGGIDVLLSARRVGPTGKAYGLDMTDEMLALARANQVNAGVTNVEFLKGNMEAIPLPDGTVDVVLSNCVIALAVDKRRVFGEVNRVLRPGGRIAIADVVRDSEWPVPEGADAGSWTDCASGALTTEEYGSVLQAAGFVRVLIEPSHAVMDGFTSVIVRASKP